MVEMVETAAILNQATARSLVILDEIGRGTATFDGLSIAWAAIEHLHETNRCRALFATHFHELTALAERLPRLANATLKVTEWQGEVVFLHEVVPGAADRSYPFDELGPADRGGGARRAGAGGAGEGRAVGAVTRLADDPPLFPSRSTTRHPPRSRNRKQAPSPYGALQPASARRLDHCWERNYTSGPPSGYCVADGQAGPRSNL